MAEVCWRRQEEADDMLRLSALAVRAAAAAAASRVSGLDDYEPPSEWLTGHLASLDDTPAPVGEPRARDPQVRAAQILQVVRAFGGEVNGA